MDVLILLFVIVTSVATLGTLAGVFRHLRQPSGLSTTRLAFNKH